MNLEPIKIVVVRGDKSFSTEMHYMCDEGENGATDKAIHDFQRFLKTLQQS